MLWWPAKHGCHVTRYKFRVTRYTISMPGVGPLYCETPLTLMSGFPVEYVNTITSFIPALLGLLALLYLVRKDERAPELYMLALLTLATGLGSVLWHGMRTPLSLALDVFPGLLYFLLFLFLWPYALGGRLRGALTFIGFFLSQFLIIRLVSLPESNGPPLSIFVTTALFAGALLVWTYRKFGHAVYWGIAMITSALLAAFFRTIDLHTCSAIPFGVHFLWHTFLGFAAYLGVIFLSQIYEKGKSFLARMVAYIKKFFG